MDCGPPDSFVHEILQERILEVSCHALFQENLTEGSNLGLLHCRQILYYVSYQGRWFLKLSSG